MKHWQTTLPKVIGYILFFVSLFIMQYYPEYRVIAYIMWIIPIGIACFFLIKGWNATRTRKENEKNWRVPGIILALLILAMAFRWGALGSRTIESGYSYNSGTYKYNIDRWNGAVYQDSLTDRGFSESIDTHPLLNMAWYSSQGLTIIWDLFMAGDIIWLLYAVSKIGKKKTDSINT